MHDIRYQSFHNIECRAYDCYVRDDTEAARTSASLVILSSSFIHSENLYSAPSRNCRYLRGYYLPKRIVPKRMYRAMHDSQMSPWNQKLTLCNRAKYPTRCNFRQWEAEVTQVR